jgi:AraC-like DNA-binding protein
MNAIQENKGIERKRHFLSNGRDEIETIRLECPSGITLSRTQLIFHPPQLDTLYRNTAKIDFKETSLFIQVLLNGSVTLQEVNSSKEHHLNQNGFFFSIARDKQISYQFDTHTDVRLVTLTFPLSLIEKLFGSYYFKVFISQLEDSSENTISFIKRLSIFSNPAYFEYPEKKISESEKIRIQQSAIDFLISLAEYHISDKAKNKFLNTESIARILYAEIEKTGGKLISYAEIENRFHISARAINLKFMHTYGISLAKFAQKTRFNEAARLLQKTMTPLKVISNLLGYSNVNNFILAFKKEFGHSPIKYRTISKNYEPTSNSSHTEQ